MRVIRRRAWRCMLAPVAPRPARQLSLERISADESHQQADKREHHEVQDGQEDGADDRADTLAEPHPPTVDRRQRPRRDERPEKDQHTERYEDRADDEPPGRAGFTPRPQGEAAEQSEPDDHHESEDAHGWRLLDRGAQGARPPVALHEWGDVRPFGHWVRIA